MHFARTKPLPADLRVAKREECKILKRILKSQGVDYSHAKKVCSDSPYEMAWYLHRLAGSPLMHRFSYIYNEDTEYEALFPWLKKGSRRKSSVK